MHFARTHHLLILITITLVISIHTFTEAQPHRQSRKGCKYWCKEEPGKYLCCPNHRKKHKNPLLHWAYEELFDLHKHPWLLIDNSWIYSLWPVFFKRSVAHDDDDDKDDDNNEDNSPQLVEKVNARCPKLRKSCLSREKSSSNSSPIPCDHDEECGEDEKCCYDVCLEHKTCKPLHK